MKKRTFICTAICAMMLCGCGSQPAKQQKDEKAMETTESKVKQCDITLAGINFTGSINEADKKVKEDSKGKVFFDSGAQVDYFNDPNGTLTATSPILLTEVDNTKPFTFTAKTTPQFSPKGTYSAGTLYAYASDSLYQKLCFEQDERGKHRVVTVRTVGTSDDNNHDVIQQPWVYLRITSNTQTIASYYSVDGKSWQLVRLYRNNYPSKLWLGISSQCPNEQNNKALFEELSLTHETVKNLRLGE